MINSDLGEPTRPLEQPLDLMQILSAQQDTIDRLVALEHQWVYHYLPAELPDATAKDAVSTGPSLPVRANGVDKIDARYDSTARSAHIRAGAVTWIVQDRVAADSMVNTWRYVARIAPAILGADRELGSR